MEIRNCQNCGKAEIDYHYKEIWCDGHEKEYNDVCDKWKPKERRNMKNPYETIEPYESKPIAENPLLDRIDSATLIAWFRCNSCPTCKWRKEVIDKDPNHDVYWCSRTHERYNIIDMVSYLGYSKE